MNHPALNASPSCLVTGGAGFIGSHLVDALVRRKCRVTVLDNFSTGTLDNLRSVERDIRIVEGDLANPATVDRAVEGADIIFHLGASASVARSVDDPLASHRVNVLGTLHVLQSARQESTPTIFATSSSVYGLAETHSQKETDPISPLSPYAADKLAGEQYMCAFAHTFGLHATCLRFFNVFGPRQRADSPYSGVIAIFLSKLLAGVSPTVYGDGLQSRDFIYVEDVVQALLLAAKVPNPTYRILNIGTGQRTTILKLASSLNQILGTELKPAFGPSRPGEVRHSCADIQRATSELGFRPSATIHQALARTVEWHQAVMA